MKRVTAGAIVGAYAMGVVATVLAILMLLGIVPINNHTIAIEFLLICLAVLV